jgi:hypothetical protein
LAIETSLGATADICRLADIFGVGQRHGNAHRRSHLGCPITRSRDSQEPRAVHLIRLGVLVSQVAYLRHATPC